MNISELTSYLDASILKKTPYRVDIDLLSTLDNLSMYSKQSDELTEIGANWEAQQGLGSQFLFERGMVPQFQRGNDKWSNSMKSAFIENILRGGKSEILLYTVQSEFRKKSFTSVKILDGLQRLSAICDFVSGKITAFGFSVTELAQHGIVSWSSVFGICIYQFKTHSDAAIYYIQMNEHITHSTGDIVRAVDFFERNMARECLLPKTSDAELEEFCAHAMQIHGPAVDVLQVGSTREFRVKTFVGDKPFHVIVGSFDDNTVENPERWMATAPVSSYVLS